MSSRLTINIIFRSIEVKRKEDKLMHFKMVGTSIDLGKKYRPDEVSNTINGYYN